MSLVSLRTAGGPAGARVPPGASFPGITPSRPAPFQAVVFDLGETLVDESRAWGLLADRVGVARAVLFAALGYLIAERRDHREVWDFLGVADPGPQEPYTADDWYPDALVGLAAARSAGLRVGIAANQPRHSEKLIREAGIALDLFATSEGWGVAKP